ncbi:hypothetical protein THRCLA_21307 [Thraustotheca clavata]|uniref:IMS import disulfide relay-system CHCH-CHCH-like Cx9C domain-containing protein n=1 Tax=Thraustotheca clavata TaxID=74557 RepID=A0A1V9ZXZ1_9STRA|nr:hypothetical protein THRCLA_21307 [Thraustotheca clavata]
MSGPSGKPTKRLSKIFGQMMTSCSVDVQVYGACVANIEGPVNRDACAKEFAMLKVCFERVAKTTK